MFHFEIPPFRRPQDLCNSFTGRTLTSTPSGWFADEQSKSSWSQAPPFIKPPLPTSMFQAFNVSLRIMASLPRLLFLQAFSLVSRISPARQILTPLCRRPFGEATASRGVLRVAGGAPPLSDFLPRAGLPQALGIDGRLISSRSFSCIPSLGDRSWKTRESSLKEG